MLSSPRYGGSLLLLSIILGISFINKLNNRGLRLQPCFKPTKDWNGRLNPFVSDTHDCNLQYMSWISLTNFPLIPAISNL